MRFVAAVDLGAASLPPAALLGSDADESLAHPEELRQVVPLWVAGRKERRRVQLGERLSVRGRSQILVHRRVRLVRHRVQLDIVLLRRQSPDLGPAVRVAAEHHGVVMRVAVPLVFGVVVLLQCYHPELENASVRLVRARVSLRVAPDQVRPQLLPGELVGLPVGGVVRPVVHVVHVPPPRVPRQGLQAVGGGELSPQSSADAAGQRRLVALARRPLLQVAAPRRSQQHPCRAGR